MKLTTLGSTRDLDEFNALLTAVKNRFPTILVMRRDEFGAHQICTEDRMTLQTRDVIRFFCEGFRYCYQTTRSADITRQA